MRMIEPVCEHHMLRAIQRRMPTEGRAANLVQMGNLILREFRREIS